MYMSNTIEDNDNKLFKICKLCNQNLSIECFRPKRRMCKKCVFIREYETHKKIVETIIIHIKKKYYYKKQIIIIKKYK